ncbi:hypothetical protein H4219_003134 [Mycoemilia scoparia]|uniref:Polysaccharide lyase 14 domain-containing protein n=1 Tax=Mycoemilia scoparia TaxID=417184 RepID=A0A9W7ZZK0_9FUNG|nr:hypothetical protein H4219_003134 [Mycoemilia scoparia]
MIVAHEGEVPTNARNPYHRRNKYIHFRREEPTEPGNGGDGGDTPGSFVLESITSVDDLKKMNLQFTWGEENCEFIDDPVSSGGGGKVLNVKIAAGSYARGNTIDKDAPKGGVGFYADPLDSEQYRGKAGVVFTFEYDILFPEGFDWVRGGKIPGQYGGTGGNGIMVQKRGEDGGGSDKDNKSCSGGDHRGGCFSARHMWRAEGGSEAYMYVPSKKQGQAYKDAAGKYFDQPRGDSLMRGAYKFTAGKWATIKQSIVINTGEESNGKFIVSYDGQEVINIQDMYWGPDGTVVSGIMFHVFFGGGEPSFATEKDQNILFKNFKYSATTSGEN